MSDIPYRSPISISHIVIGSILVTLVQGSRALRPRGAQRCGGRGRRGGRTGMAYHTLLKLRLNLFEISVFLVELDPMMV
jgi:hypothetical protein